MTEHISRQEYQSLQAQPKRKNKFNAKRVLLDGILFDSKAERDYYAALKLRERAGEVTDIELQRDFDLIVNGVHVCRYRADFVYFSRLVHRRIVADVKGCITPEFRLKSKLMKACHGIDIEVVK